MLSKQPFLPTSHLGVSLKYHKTSPIVNLKLLMLPASVSNTMYTRNNIRFLANSEDPDKMEHNAAFHLGPHKLLRLKQHPGTKIHHNLGTYTCDP